VSYIFDTCAWIGAWKERYPIDRFPDLWEKFSELIGSGRIRSVQRVRDEIDSPEKLVEWLKDQENLYLPPSQEEENLASEIINSKEGKGLRPKKRPDTADPNVIARAEIEGWTVVTQEGVRGKGIPAVCGKRGVKCVNLIGFFREQEWEFHLR